MSTRSDTMRRRASAVSCRYPVISYKKDLKNSKSYLKDNTAAVPIIFKYIQMGEVA